MTGLIIHIGKRLLQLMLLLLSETFLTLQAQHIGYKQYTVADGLVQSEVTVIHQDQKGFIWVGTKMGLSRFDGIAFEIIRDSANIFRSSLWYIDTLNDSTLIVLTSRGYGLITYGKTGMNIKTGDIAFPYYCRWIRNKKLEIIGMVGEKPSLFVIDHTGVREEKCPIPGLTKQEIFDHRGFRVFYSSKYNAYYLTDLEGIFAVVKNNRRSTLQIPVREFITGMDGELYLYTIATETITQKTAITINRINDTVIAPFYQSGPRFANHELAGCIIDSDRFFIADPFDQSLIRYSNEKEERFKTDHVTGWHQFYDQEGNLWMGGPLGLTRLFSFSVVKFTEKDGYIPNGQSVFTDANDDLVVASFDRGLHILKDGVFQSVPVRNLHEPAARVNLYPGGRRDSRGIAHIMCVPNTVVRWDGKNIIYPEKYPLGGAFCFFDDTEKRLWYYGTDGGLLIQPYQGKYFVDSVFPGKKKNKIVAIAKDRKGRLVLGGFQGTSFWSKEGTIHLPTPEIPYDQGSNAMATDLKGNIWIGNTDGLYLFDGEKFRKIGNSRFNDFIVSLHMVDTSFLFIGGLRAFGLLDLKRFYSGDTALIHYFDRNSGFTGEECQQNAVTTDTAGNLWFLGTNNLFRISPRALARPPASVPVYITRVSVITPGLGDTSLSPRTMPVSVLEFRYRDNNIRFDFAGLYFQAPDQVRYRYRLDGYSEAWSNPASERYATFTNLSPGTYTFRVLAASDSGDWPDQEASITIIIHPAFWQTWWFRILIPLMFAVLFFWLGFIFMNRKRKRETEKLETEKRMAELHLISMRNQIDPHFTFNAINSIASVILKEEKEKAYSFFVKLSAMIRQVLTSGDKITRPLAEELGFVKNYLEIEKLRFRESFQFAIEVEEGVNPDQEVPKMVIQTYAENALKHGLLNKKEGEGLLTIKISEESGNLRIVVEDNGIGRQAARKLGSQSTGKGLHILNSYYDFFNRYNQHKIQHEIVDLFTDQNQPAGMRVVVIIPSGFHFQLKLHETR
jgi:anti-sigma regulatory factor (Ser/Thr protein kinase)